LCQAVDCDDFAFLVIGERIAGHIECFGILGAFGCRGGTIDSVVDVRRGSAVGGDGHADVLADFGFSLGRGDGDGARCFRHDRRIRHQHESKGGEISAVGRFVGSRLLV